MSVTPDEAALIAARELRDVARSIVRTDVRTLRLSLAERPLARRMRDQAVSAVVDTAERGIDLALENRALLGVTLAAIIGWLFRKPLGSLGHQGWNWLRRRIAERR